MADDNAQLLGWFYEIPPVSRLYLSAAVGVTSACFLDVVSPLTLYYNYDLIMGKGQYWRLVTSFLFFGSFSLDFLFHMYVPALVCVCSVRACVSHSHSHPLFHLHPPSGTL